MRTSTLHFLCVLLLLRGNQSVMLCCLLHQLLSARLSEVFHRSAMRRRRFEGCGDLDLLTILFHSREYCSMCILDDRLLIYKCSDRSSVLFSSMG